MTETNDKSAATLLIGPIKEILTPICNDNKPIRGQAMDTIKHIKNGGIAVNNDKIIAIGAYDDVKTQITTNANTQYIDASDNIAIPGFIDPHTHLVFAGNRASEFVERTLGKTYQQIAQAGSSMVLFISSVYSSSLLFCGIAWAGIKVGIRSIGCILLSVKIASSNFISQSKSRP